MRKIIDEFPFLSHMSMGLRLAALRAAGAPLFKITSLADWTIIGIYRSPKVPVRQLYLAIAEMLSSIRPENNIIILGDFNINWLVETERRPLCNLLVRDKHYKQLISTFSIISELSKEFPAI